MPLVLSDLFKFRDVYEAAIAAVLATATGGTAHVSQSTASKTAVWIDVDFDAGKSIKHKALYSGGYYDDMYKGAMLTVRVCSVRQTSGQPATHKTYAAKIIVAMTPGTGKFTTSNLPYHQLIDTTLAGESFGVIEEQALDVTELKWECAHGIRPEAWAQIIVPEAPENITAPTITSNGDLDNPIAGDVLTVSTPGTYSGSPTPTRSYRWKYGSAGPSAGANAPGTGGATASYTVNAADEGDNLYCAETATNAEGSDSADSNESGVVLGSG